MKFLGIKLLALWIGFCLGNYTATFWIQNLTVETAFDRSYFQAVALIFVYILFRERFE